MVQSVLLLGAETWVVTPRTEQVLWGFQDQVERRSTDRFLQRQQDRKWEYTSAATAREEVEFEEMGEYIRRMHNKVTHFIATQSIMYLCEDKQRTPG